MAFKLLHDDVYQKLNTYHSDSQPVNDYPWYNVAREMTYPNQSSLNIEQRNILEYARITSCRPHPVKYNHSINHENFSLTYYLCSINYGVLLASHTRYDSTSGSRITSKNFSTSGTIGSVLAISVQDILHLYYYNNRDKKSWGFDSLTKAEIKLYKELIKKSISTEKPPNLKHPFAVGCSKSRFNLFRIENEKFRPAFEDFLAGLVVVDFNKIDDFQLVRDILDMYNYSEIKENEVEIIHYDPPISLVEAYRLNEDLENHKVRIVYNELTRKLTSNEETEITNYPEYQIAINTSLPTSRLMNSYWYVPRTKERDFTYPTYAFRNYLVSSWIAGVTSYDIWDQMEDKIRENKNSKLKYLKKKKGQFITANNDGQNGHLLYGGHGGFGKFGNRRKFEMNQNKINRGKRYDIKSATDLARE